MILNAENVLKFVPSGLGEFGKLAQVGVDLSIKEIKEIQQNAILPAKGKAEIPEYLPVNFSYNEEDKKVWHLESGKVYSLTFHQTVSLDNKHCAFVINRSSIKRMGLIIESAVYDPGFQSADEGCGATCYAFYGCHIEEGARVAQLIIHECEEAEKYSGSYQKNNDRL